MDAVAQYKQYIMDILTEYSTYIPSYGEIERETVFDQNQNHFQLLSVGWNGYERIHGTVLHVDIRNNKIWIQYDGTEEGIANRLVELGVPPQDIVLAFHPPYKRQYTKFAVG